MPCRSPQTVSVAQPTPYLSMSQQHPSLNGGMSQQPSQQPPQLTPQQIQQNSQQQQQQQNKQKTAPSYNEKAMAVIRNSLRPFEQADQPLRPVSSLSTGSSNNSNYSDCIHTLMNMGFDEESSYRATVQSGGRLDTACDLLHRQMESNHLTARNVAALNSRKPEYSNGHHVLHRASPLGVPNGSSNGPPALPPRSHHLDPPKIPSHPIATNGTEVHRKYSPNSDVPPPLPPRGSTPPPPSQNGLVYSNSPVTTSLPPPLLRRMSPVPAHSAQRNQMIVSAAGVNQRGTSPVTTAGAAPLKVNNSREIQAQFQQQLQSMQMFPNEHTEPPPPYPMGSAATPNGTNPPPSYSQSMSLRQSPTLSSTSSDYRYTEFRRSPAPVMAAAAANHILYHPIPPSPSPSASSLMSSSSRTSSTLQAWSSRQAKTQSPVIVQSVKSTQVQKPVLQTATTPEVKSGSVTPVGAPPSYEMYQLSKVVQAPSPVIVSNSPVPKEVIKSSEGSNPPLPQGALPPPPPYPSTKVGQLVNSKQSTQGAVISTAKVVSSSKPVLQRKYSPLTSETASSSASRSESPETISSENTVSCSPSSFNDPISADSGLPESTMSSLMPPPPPPPYKATQASKEKTTHISSPKPERRHMSPAKEDLRKSYIKTCPPEAYKFFMEQHIDRIWKEYRERTKRQEKLAMELDELYGRNETVTGQKFSRADFKTFMQKVESNHLRTKRAKLNKNDFKLLKRIGAGAFGEVSLVRKKSDNPKITNNKPTNMAHPKQMFTGLYAMKKLRKSVVVQRSQVAHVIAEKDILSEANNDWIVKLHYSFQDKNNLYFVMEYIPGGDLMSKLIKDHYFSEDLARFYIAELTCAVESVHAMNFIHRDIKPDNILIDYDGHIKLTDFGLCTGFRWTHKSAQYKSKNGESAHIRQDSMDPGSMNLEQGLCSCSHMANGMKPLERRKRAKRCTAHSLVGTPNYIAPEVLSRDYNQTCDWWSVGVILYEMIVGRPPFLHDDARETQSMIIQWQDYLSVPNEGISKESADLIKRLLCSAKDRLGSQRGAEEIKEHPFFNGFDFSKDIRKMEAPWKPLIKNPEDTSYFDFDDDTPPRQMEDEPDNDDDTNGNEFYGFTFKRHLIDGGQPPTFFQGSASSNSSKNEAKSNNPDPVYV